MEDYYWYEDKPFQYLYPTWHGKYPFVTDSADLMKVMEDGLNPDWDGRISGPTCQVIFEKGGVKNG